MILWPHPREECPTLLQLPRAGFAVLGPKLQNAENIIMLEHLFLQVVKGFHFNLQEQQLKGGMIVA
jgi:hypothetical protein